MVHNPNKLTSPTKKHKSYVSAKEEAERLAGKEMAPVYVLEAVGVAAPSSLPIEYKEID